MNKENEKNQGAPIADPEKQNRFKFYQAVETELAFRQTQDEVAGNSPFAHLFIGLVDKGQSCAITGTISGGEQNLIQLMIQFFNNNDTPASIKKALLVAAANVIAEVKEATSLAMGIGIFIEKEFGHVDCSCERCKAAKQNVN